MANIKFSYLYRDSGNYKNWRDIVFDNPGKVNIDDLTSLIRSKLIDGLYFCADDWLLPDLHFDAWNSKLDHTWHEFQSVAYTNDAVNFPVDLNCWISKIR